MAPLFAKMKRLLRRAAHGSAHETADESRRRFVIGGAAAALSVPFFGATSCDAGVGYAPVAIVGAGLAGLHAAYRLKQRGLYATVFEAGKRVGGRILSDRTTFAKPDGQHCELGGELIDSDHTTMRDLATELALPLLDYTMDDGSLTDAVFIGGKLVSDGDLLASFQPIAAQIELAQKQAVDPSVLPSYTNDNGLGALDQLSIAAWLDSVGASGPARTLIELAYVVEYGLETSEQSALNLLTLISPDASKLALYGASDQRFHCALGNDAFTTRLAAALDPSQMLLERKLTRVELRDDGRYLLSFDSPDGTVDIDAVRVILALPFTLLRDVELVGITLPAAKQRAIAELGYGTNEKLMTGFSSRPWRVLGSQGTSYTDIGYESTFDTSRLQPGMSGILTNYTGGQAGLALAMNTPEQQRDAFLKQLDEVFPNAGGHSNGLVARSAWSANDLSRGSRSVYKVGQWTAFGGVEGERVGNLLFAGEHTSTSARGSMEGAALSGAMAADVIAADLALPTPEWLRRGR